MTAERIHCPYCNAAINMTETSLAQQRLRCPRCGDSFRNRYYLGLAESANDMETGFTENPASAPPAPAGELDPLQQARPRRMSNADIARLFLGIMIGMAGLGITFALLTVPFRRQHDIKKLTPAEARLAAITYLPADAHIAFAANLAALREQPEGERLLQQLKGEDAILGLGQITRWTGLQVEDIDRLALGIRTGEDLPRFTVVVQTRQPYDLQRLADALAPAKPDFFLQRPVYRARLKPVGESLVWLHNNQTIIIDIHLLAAQLDDLRQLPAKPHEGLQPFSETIQRAAHEQTELAGTFLWGGGSLKEIEPLKQWLQLGAKKADDDFDWLGKVRAFQVGLRLQEEVIVNAALQAKDKETAEQLQTYLEENRPQAAESYTVVGPGSKQGQKMPDDDSWVTVQMRFSSAGVLEWLEQISNLKKMHKGK